MAVVPMQKVAILAFASLREELIDMLHGEGVIEITEAQEPSKVDHTEVQFRTAELKYAIDTLKEVASKETSAASQKPNDVRGVLFSVRHTDVRGIIEQLHELEASDTEAEHRMQELLALQRQLKPWEKLKSSLERAMETGTTVLLFGTLPEAACKALSEKLATSLPRTELTEVNAVKGTASITVNVWKEDTERFEEIATGMGFTNLEMPHIPGTPAEILIDAATELRKLRETKEGNGKERTALSVELPNLLNVQRFIRWLDEKQAAREALAETGSTVTLLGWMPRSGMATLEEKLKQLSPATLILKVKPDEGEEPPVLLKNPRIVTPFQSVTNLYGLPLPSEKDPTSALAPFFIIYFALCLTDAGYGITLALVFGTVLFRTKKSVHEATLLWLLLLGGVMTFLTGILFGGWFGLTPEQVPGFLTKVAQDGTLLFRGQIWNLGTQAGITFLQNTALFLGITHLFFGMFLAGYHKWIHGKRAAAFWQHFTSHILLGAIIFRVAAPAELAETARYALYGAIALLVWGKGYGTRWFLRPLLGALGVLNFAISMLSNTLSYLRILALGLVTGALALAVNQLALEIGSLFPVFLAIPLIVVITFFGHLIFIALNTLGSFVHSGRLQFIEFFSQFFEGGGRAFHPFKRSIT